MGNLLAAYHHLLGLIMLEYQQLKLASSGYNNELDMQDVMGKPMAKRALEIAASGGDNLLFSRPAGTGKSMLAQRLTTITKARK